MPMLPLEGICVTLGQFPNHPASQEDCELSIFHMPGISVEEKGSQRSGEQTPDYSWEAIFILGARKLAPWESRLATTGEVVWLS